MPRHHLARRFMTLALLCATCGSAVAADSLVLAEITIRGDRQQANEESLTIREVREGPARDLGEALQNVPGLNIVRKGAIANDIVLRGFQRDNLNVFLDGVRLHGGCPSRMDPPSFHFDFAEVESVEITKGPYDLHNPGSLGGTINAISKTPGNGLEAAANLSYGSFNYLDTSLTGSYGSTSWDGLAGLAFKSSDVPEAGDGKRLTEIYPATSMNRYRPENIDTKAYETTTLWLKGGYLHAKGRSELGISYQNAEHVLYPYLLMDANYDRTLRFNWTTTLNNLTPTMTKLHLQAWHNQVEHQMDDTLRMSSTPSMMVTRPYMMQTDAETMTSGAKIHADLSLGTGQLATGIDVYRRNWDAVNESAMWMSYAPQPMIPDVNIDNLGLFAEYSLPLLGNITLKGGARIDHTNAEANELTAARLTTLYQPYFSKNLETEVDYTEASANLQVTWQANSDLELFAGAASASRTLDQQELFIGLQRMAGKNWLGNPSLEATRNNQLDVGAKWAGSKLFASASLFYSNLTDFVYVTDQPDPDGAGPLIRARTYGNIDVSLWGAELGSQLALPASLFLKGTCSYVRGKNEDTGSPLAEIPPLTGTLSLRYDNGSWFAEATERVADSQSRVDPSLQEVATSGWGVTDLKAGANWNRWSVTGGANNLFDRYYFSHLSYQRDPFASGVKVPETGLFAYLNLAYRY
jgi:iron complex outermembrane recepter protein